MAVVIVILLNILIAQMSNTYNEAKKLARLKYDIQRMYIITRLEHSRLHRFVSSFFILFLRLVLLTQSSMRRVSYFKKIVFFSFKSSLVLT